MARHGDRATDTVKSLSYRNTTQPALLDDVQDVIVRHEKWDAGMVMRGEADKMTIRFDEVGYKTRAMVVVQEKGLLQPMIADEGPLSDVVKQSVVA